MPALGWHLPIISRFGVLILLAVFLFHSVLAAGQASSLVQVGNSKTQLHQTLPNLTNLLAFPTVEENVVFETANKLIKQIEARPSCFQKAAAQLLLTCKGIRKDTYHTTSKDELFDTAKSVYGIRAALCETTAGKSNIPASCNPMVILPSRLWGEIEIVDRNILGQCIQTLQKQHYHWTSYSNNRQNAESLCQAANLETERLELLNSYRLLAELIPDFGQVLRQYQLQSHALLEEQRQAIEELLRLQRESFEVFDEYSRTGQTKLASMVEQSISHLSNVSLALQSSFSDTEDDLAKLKQGLIGVGIDLAQLNNTLRQVFENAMAEYSSLMSRQVRENQELQELTQATKDIVLQIGAENVAQVIESLESQLTGVGIRLTSLQDQAVSNAIKIQQMGEKALGLQQQTTLLAERGKIMISETVNDIATLRDIISMVIEPLKSILPENFDFNYFLIETSLIAAIAGFSILSCALRYWSTAILSLALYVIFQAFRVLFWATNAYQKIYFVCARSDILIQPIITLSSTLTTFHSFNFHNVMRLVLIGAAGLILFLSIWVLLPRSRPLQVPRSLKFARESIMIAEERARGPNARAVTVPP